MQWLREDSHIMTDSMFSIVSIDPGMSTGIVFADVYKDKPLDRDLTTIQQIEGGIGALDLTFGYIDILSETKDLTVICERFTPRPLRRSYKSNELEPLRIEGALIAWDLMPPDYKDPRWRSPQYQVLRKGEDAAESKKLSNNVLRHMGLWTTGKQVGCKDANDANSAMKHLISYLVQIGHEPTMKLLTESPR